MPERMATTIRTTDEEPIKMSSDSAIVEDYDASIKELTFNSRPIIQSLTDIAKENTDVADGILNVITNRIYKCIPEQKLFALYLLDSICKTVGNPYNILVGDDIFKLFSHVYLLVNDNVRVKLSNLFETWKLTKSKGTALPLFPKEQTDKIENFLAQAGYKKKSPSSESKKLTNSSLIQDIETIIPIFENKLINNPDSKLTDRYNALIQLKTLLSSQTMKPNELQAVQAQLNSIKQQELSTPKLEPLTPSTTVSTPASSITPATTPGLSFSQIQETPSVINHVSKANELFNVLIISGLVKVDQSLKPGSKPSYEVVLPKNKYIPNDNKNANNEPSINELEELLLSATNANLSEYEKLKNNELMKLSKKISVNSDENNSKNLQTFLNQNQLDASAVQLLYECKSSKCGTCGKRFTTDEQGSTRKRLHLDWHFRINKKLANAKSNVQSRNWYLDDYDWVKFRDEDLLEYSTTANKTAVATTSAAAVPATNYVIIPSTEKNMNNKCIICRETIKATYNDEIGEWCWFDAVRAPNDKTGRKIIHISCFNEANRKREAPDSLNSNVKREKLQ